jgi:methylenetetrahydrofolate reductase (NADPH)
VRYLDSVNALDVARQRSAEFLLGGAVSPFKYREEEFVNQYLKAAKKLRAGANFLMTQIGWDVRKFQELSWFLDQRGYRAALIAECLFLTPARSQRIRMLGLPGVTITDDLAQRLQETAASPDGGQAAAFRRLALQIAGARDLGYAGAQVSGLETYASIVRLAGRRRDCDPGVSDARSAPAWLARAANAQGWSHRTGGPSRWSLLAGIGVRGARGPSGKAGQYRGR